MIDSRLPDDVRAVMHRLELVTLSLRRLVGDPYGRPIRPYLRVVPSTVTSVPAPEVES